MCGIAGFWDWQAADGEESLRARARQMIDALRHRGPDDAGVWCDPSKSIALANRRLAVLDLSESGHQPMWSRCGRYCLAYNGEVYNHEQLRRQLSSAGCAFRGHSDTEVLVEAISVWGVTESIARLNGMFSFAVWDRESQTLTLVRDRLGIKPLYYSLTDQGLIFASELKAMRRHPRFDRTVDRDALALFLQHNYIPSPYSIFRSVRKLPGGCLLQISREKDHATVRPTTYWRLKDIAEYGCREVFTGSAGDAADQLEELLRSAVRLRASADVPVGAFLSGGVDSSMVVALMQQQCQDRIRTFTLGFEDKAYDEAPFAAAIAGHLGTDHEEQYVTAREAREVIPRLAQIYDEPLADPSQIPTLLICQLARRFVTVALSGDGGDELFGGYHRYRSTAKAWRKLGRLPHRLRQFARLPIPLASRLLGGRSHMAGKLRLLAHVLDARDGGQLYSRLHTHWKEPHLLVVDGSLPETEFSRSDRWPSRGSLVEQFTYVDTITYLPDDILVKLDRASMAVSLEARTPLLDHRVVEFTWHLPAHVKFSTTSPKSLLRKVLNRYVPPALLDRPKRGFGVPLATWLRGPLRPWAEELLDEHRLKREGYFHPQPIRDLWREHLHGSRDWHYYLWDILMFQAWLEQEA